MVLVLSSVLGISLGSGVECWFYHQLYVSVWGGGKGVVFITSFMYQSGEGDRVLVLSSALGISLGREIGCWFYHQL